MYIHGCTILLKKDDFNISPRDVRGFTQGMAQWQSLLNLIGLNLTFDTMWVYGWVVAHGNSPDKNKDPVFIVQEHIRKHQTNKCIIMVLHTYGTSENTWFQISVCLPQYIIFQENCSVLSMLSSTPWNKSRGRFGWDSTQWCPLLQFFFFWLSDLILTKYM